MDVAVQAVLESLETVILGKRSIIKLILAGILAKGHILLEDLPGMGKTTLAQAIAKSLGLDFQRIQFTSDILPADILGVSIFNKQDSTFSFQKGPVFAQLILADEINRATPKAQGALLEAMEEAQVTIDGNRYLLPKPFFVIATQNPQSQFGTFPLPEAQLDRFLMRLTLGYPDPAAEREIIMGKDRRSLIQDLQVSLNFNDIFKLQLAAKQVHISEAILDYVQRLVAFTRENSRFTYGLSPRGTLALVHSAKAFALIEGRDHVLPEDIQTVLMPVVEHRVSGHTAQTGTNTIYKHTGSLSSYLLDSVSVVA